jgi:hypothetical protein
MYHLEESNIDNNSSYLGKKADMTFTIINTKTTPFAELRNGHLEIRGKSVPFNHPEFYDTIKDRLTVYMKRPEKYTTVDFSLSAVNAASKRSIINTFRVFEEMSKKGCELEITWHYQLDDEDVFELGEICKSSFEVNMHMKEIA